MSAGIRINIFTHGDYAYGQTPIPLEVNVADHKSRLVETRTAHTGGELFFPLDPGVYSITVITPSGSLIQKIVKLQPDESQQISMPLYEISPREDYEWAYMTQKHSLSQMGYEPLREQKLTGAWLRFWVRSGAKHTLKKVTFDSYETPNGRFITITNTPDTLSCLQVGGPAVPWKCVALPPQTTCKILIEAAVKENSLNVSVASGNMALDGILAYLERGELDTASKFEMSQLDLAEALVYQKQKDPISAAVGGYYILRRREINRLHDWANNLANWFTWMPDGAIIHAWQLIYEYRENGDADTRLLEQARERLMEAVARGYPIYTEGLRLLRDGLLMMQQHSGVDNPALQAAVNQAGGYYSAADLTTINTTFLGETPDNPSPRPVTGIPQNRSRLKFIFD
jgi:hypothetical protein